MAATGMEGFSSMESQSRNFRLKIKICVSFQTFCKTRDIYEKKHQADSKNMLLAFVAFNTEQEIPRGMVIKFFKVKFIELQSNHTIPPTLSF